MTQRGYYDQTVDSTPLPQHECFPRGEAHRMARRAFWRGMALGAIAAIIGSVAHGGDTAMFGGTGCQLVPVTGQDHIAEVRCRNVETAGPDTNEAEMTAGDVSVQLYIHHWPGDMPDEFTVTPQPGYIADPQSISLEEWAGGVIRIYPFIGT